MQIIAGAALNQTPLAWAENRKHILAAIAAAKAKGVQLLCMPELCITGYGCEDLFLAPWVQAEALAQLVQLQKEAKGIYFSVGLPLLVAGKLYNGCALLGEGKVLGIALKQILANGGIYYEPRWFAAWPSGQKSEIDLDGHKVPVGDLVFDCQGTSVAFEICEEAWAGNQRTGYQHAKNKVDIILNPSGSNFAFAKKTQRAEIVVGGSKAFDCTYIYANLLGNESGRLIFDGDVLLAQKGQLLARSEMLTFDKFTISMADRFATPEPSNTRLTKLEEFTNAAILGLYDYMRKSRSRGFAISLSGGADSAACAVLVHLLFRRLCQTPQDFEADLSYFPQLKLEAAGIKDFLTLAYQATENSSETTLDSAKAIAENVGAPLHHIDVEPFVAAYSKEAEKTMGSQLTWDRDNLTMQNIQARVRAPMIWMLANMREALLISTSNRSEGAVGYCTMDGDMAGGLAPLAGVDKAFLKLWLQYAEKELGYTGLAMVNGLQPTAELKPEAYHQTDEAELMPYPVLDRIERMVVFERLSPLEIYKKMKADGEDMILMKGYLIRFFSLFARSQWKRERMAPSFHLDDYNLDPRSWYRFPILSAAFGAEVEALKKL